MQHRQYAAILGRITQIGMDLDQKIEGVLFYKAAPVRKKDLCTLLDIAPETLEQKLTVLGERLAFGATRLVITDSEVELVTAPELDEFIDDIRKDELKRDIGKAGAETLAIVLYRGPISRAEIDRIRGVNSSYILRNLMTRGLVERTAQSKQNQYQITPSLLKHLGINKRHELPGFQETMDALEAYEAQQEQTAETRSAT